MCKEISFLHYGWRALVQNSGFIVNTESGNMVLELLKQLPCGLLKNRWLDEYITSLLFITPEADSMSLQLCILCRVNVRFSFVSAEDSDGYINKSRRWQ